MSPLMASCPTVVAPPPDDAYQSLTMCLPDRTATRERPATATAENLGRTQEEGQIGGIGVKNNRTPSECSTHRPGQQGSVQSFWACPSGERVPSRSVHAAPDVPGVDQDCRDGAAILGRHVDGGEHDQAPRRLHGEGEGSMSATPLTALRPGRAPMMVPDRPAIPKKDDGWRLTTRPASI
jgi:hypothetical protein